MSSGTKPVLQSGQVFWSRSIQRSTQFRWKICRQFFKHRISSSSENSNKQTAQQQSSSVSVSSPYFVAGKNSRIRSADTEGFLHGSGVDVASSPVWMVSVSRKSERPRKWKRRKTRLRRRPRRVKVWRNRFGNNTSA